MLSSAERDAGRAIACGWYRRPWMSQAMRARLPTAVSPAWVLAPVGVAVVAGATFIGARHPLSALVVVTGAAIVGLALARVEVALHLLIATAPLEAAFRVSENALLSPSKLAGALTLSSFVLWLLATRSRLAVDRVHGILVLLLGIAMVSTLQARSVADGLNVTVRYAGFVLLFLVVSQVATDPAVLTRVAWVLALSCAASAVIGLQRYFSGEAYSASLPFNNQNDFAYILATSLPLALWLLRSPGRRPLVLALVTVISAGAALAFSRGALLGLGAALAWYLATQRRHRRVAVAAALLTVLGAVAVVRLDPARFDSSVEVKNRVADKNVESRLVLWRAAAGLAASHPFLGIGPGNFTGYFYEATDIPLGVENLLVVHNAYLDVATELGFPAMVLFVLYLLITFQRVSTLVKEGRGPPGYASAVQTALVVAIVGALTLSEQYFAPLWVLGGLVAALWRSSLPSRTQSA